MSNSTSHPKYSTVAPKVKNNGWDPIPVKRRSKVPAVAGWRDADADTRQSWQDKHAHCSTGIRLGGESNLIAVDSDTPDEATAKAVRTVLHRLLDEIEGDGVRMERIGNAPKFFVPLRCSTSQRKRVVAFKRGSEQCAVEILGEGQYFVASGIHPDTDKKYVWPGERNPTNTTVSELPEVATDWIDKFLDRCVEAFEELGWAAGETRAPLNGDLPAPLAGLDLDEGLCKAIVEFALLPEAKGGCGVADGKREPLRDLLFGVVERLGVSDAVRDWLKPLFQSDEHTGWEAYFDSQWDDAKTRSSDGACGVTFATVLKHKYDDQQRFDSWWLERESAALHRYSVRIDEITCDADANRIISDARGDTQHLSRNAVLRLAQPLNNRLKNGRLGAPGIKALKARLLRRAEVEASDTSSMPVGKLDGVSRVQDALEELMTCFVDQNGTPYVELVEDSRRLTFATQSQPLLDWLTLNSRPRFGVRLGKQLAGEVVTWLSARARASGNTLTVSRRYGVVEASDIGDCDRHIEDVGDPDGTLIEVSRDGVRVLSEDEAAALPIRLIPSGSSTAMSHHEPVKDSQLISRCDALINDLNVPTGLGAVVLGLLVSWRLSAGQECAILQATGRHDSGKSTFAERIALLIDPRPDPRRKVRLDDRSATAVLGQDYATVLDNASGILSGVVSDTLCTAADGSVSAQRELGTTDDVRNTSTGGPTIITSISSVLVNSDALSRSIELRITPPPQPVDGAAARRQFHTALPSHHATLRALAARVLLLREDEAVDTKAVGAKLGGHRYRSFEGCVNAVAHILGTGQTFVDLMATSVGGALHERFEQSLFAQDVQALVLRVERQSRRWTSVQLTQRLERFLGARNWADRYRLRDYPQSSRAVRNALRDLVDVLAAVGVDVEVPETKSDGLRYLVLGALPDSPDALSIERVADDQKAVFDTSEFDEVLGQVAH